MDNLDLLDNAVGIGFVLTKDSNYDLENKKLTNVQNGDNNNDVMVKRQIEGYVSNKTKYLDGVLPAQVLNNKAIIYSPSGGVHSICLVSERPTRPRGTFFHREPG